MIHHVKVTEEHMRIGHPRHCYMCAVALAASDAIRTQAYVEFFGEQSSKRLVISTRERIYRVPAVVAAFVEAYDKLATGPFNHVPADAVLPPEFEFDLVESESFDRTLSYQDLLRWLTLLPEV